MVMHWSIVAWLECCRWDGSTHTVYGSKENLSGARAGAVVRHFVFFSS